MLRRYGNVVIHGCETVRYVEYSVLSDKSSVEEAPNVSSSGTPPGQEGAVASLSVLETQSTDSTVKRPLDGSIDEREQDICERQPHPFYT